MVCVVWIVNSTRAYTTHSYLNTNEMSKRKFLWNLHTNTVPMNIDKHIHLTKQCTKKLNDWHILEAVHVCDNHFTIRSNISNSYQTRHRGQENIGCTSDHWKVYPIIDIFCTGLWPIGKSSRLCCRPGNKFFRTLVLVVSRYTYCLIVNNLQILTCMHVEPYPAHTHRTPPQVSRNVHFVKDAYMSTSLILSLL